MSIDGLDIFFTAPPPGEPSRRRRRIVDGQPRVPVDVLRAAPTGLMAPPVVEPRAGAAAPTATGTGAGPLPPGPAPGGPAARTGSGHTHLETAGRPLSHLELRAEVDRWFASHELKARMVIKDWLAQPT